MLKIDWTTSLDFDNYFILNSEHNGENLYIASRNQQPYTSNNHN